MPSTQPTRRSNEQQPQPQQAQQPQLPSLDTIVPRLEEHSFDTEFLSQVTKTRQWALNRYLDKLHPGGRAHPLFPNPATFGELKRILNVVNDQTTTLVSVDIESHEANNKELTEVGLTIYDPAKDSVSLYPSLRTIHILIEENLPLRNGKFVDDQKEKFLGGDSLILNKHEARLFIQTIIDYYFTHRLRQRGLKAVLVGHSISGDYKLLKALGVNFPTPLTMVDTLNLFTLSHGRGNASLGAILRRFDIPHGYLHNAGNDSYYTLILLLKLCDPQFRRWKGIDSAVEREFSNNRAIQREDREEEDVWGQSEPAVKRNGRKNTELGAPRRPNGYQDALKISFHQIKGR